MLVFFILWLLILVAAWDKENEISFWSILLVFSVLIGFRSLTVGVDIKAYYQMFHMVGRNGYHGYPEPLYGYLMYFIYQIKNDFHFCQWVFSLLMLSCYAFVIRRESPNRIFSWFVLLTIYFICYTMNVNRQMIAVSVVLYAYYWLNRNKTYAFMGWVVVASLIHSTAMVALIALFYKKIKLDDRLLIYILLIASFFVGLLLNNDMISPFIGSYEGYLDKADGYRTEGRTLQAFFLSLYWTGLFLYVYETVEDELHENFWMKLYFMAILVMNVMLRLELGLRVVFYFSVVEVVLFPLYLANVKESYRVVSPYVVVLFLSVFFFYFLSTNSAGVLHYSSILF